MNRFLFGLSITLMFVSDVSADAPLLLHNQNIANGCNILNLGLGGGTVNMEPVFELATYVCNPGYYLPADSENCMMCPNNNYCVGGAYQYNAHTPQGIMECPNSWYSPLGMHELESCGRILHIGDEVVYLRSSKKTTPSLNVDIDNDGIADFFGNMTTLDVPMNRDTERKLKVNYDGTTYSVYDDSVELIDNTQ